MQRILQRKLHGPCLSLVKGVYEIRMCAQDIPLPDHASVGRRACLADKGVAEGILHGSPQLCIIAYKLQCKSCLALAQPGGCRLGSCRCRPAVDLRGTLQSCFTCAHDRQVSSHAALPAVKPCISVVLTDNRLICYVHDKSVGVGRVKHVSMCTKTSLLFSCWEAQR